MLMGGAHAVLVVDDNKDLGESLVAAMGFAGHRGVAASDGAQALALLRQGFRPCLILLDLWMPVMTGWEFRREQLKDADLASIPTVVMTAYGGAPALDGILAWVPKPIDIDQIEAMLRELCPQAS
jgi:CheY-like chemotaxis protein